MPAKVRGHNSTNYNNIPRRKSQVPRSAGGILPLFVFPCLSPARLEMRKAIRIKCLEELKLLDKAVKGNKLRKLVLSTDFMEHHPGATWTDFAESLKELVQTNAIQDDVNANGDTVYISVESMTSSTKKNTERKRTSDDESVNDISTAAAAARKRAKKEGEQLLQKQPISASLAVTRTIEMPSGFVPFLLRANGLKLANIETNSKTRIQVEQGRQRKGAPLDEKHDTECRHCGQDQR